MGPTKVFRARHTSPDTIRGQFGLTDTRNTTHGSGINSSIVYLLDHIIMLFKIYFLIIYHLSSKVFFMLFLPSSDSVESAQKEIKFFFPDFCMDRWMKEEEPSFRAGHVRYDPQRMIHLLSAVS